MTSVLALDLSSTATGICHRTGLFEPDGQIGVTSTFKPKGTLLERARQTRQQVLYALDSPGADLVVIEAIATRHTQTAIAIATVHALVLDAIPAHVQVLTVAPAQLKRWATGKGNADKTAMVTAAMKAGWSAPDGCTDDQADAWWLWTLGHALGGTWHVPETAYRAAVLDDLTKEK